MDIENVHISLNGMIQHRFSVQDGLVHQKELFQFSVIRMKKGLYYVSEDRDALGEPFMGQIFIASPSKKQYIRTMDKVEFMEAHRLFLNVDVNKVCSIDWFYDFPVTIPRENEARIISYIEDMAKTNDAFDKQILTVKIAKELFKTATPRPEKPNFKIIGIINYIRKNYAQNLTVPQIANMHYMSESALYGLFKKYCGTTPIAYINNCRLAEASRLLTRGNMSVSEIAKCVGFEDFGYFCRIFKRKYTQTPTEYRKSKILWEWEP